MIGVYETAQLDQRGGRTNLVEHFTVGFVDLFPEADVVNEQVDESLYIC